MTTQFDPERLATILAEHPNLGDGFCSQCDAEWPCLTYRLAADADGQRFAASILAEEVERLTARAEAAEARATTAEQLVADEFRVYREAISYAVTALEGSSDNGDRYCAYQLRAALTDPPAGPCHDGHHDPMCAVLLRHQACNQGAG